MVEVSSDARPSPNQNIDEQTVLNQSPDALVVFLNLDDRGEVIRELDLINIPDVDDVMSIDLQMGSTGTIGKFTIKINNDNSKYIIPDAMEEEIENLNAGQIIVVTDPKNNVVYNTLPAGVTWGDVKTFLNRTAWPRLETEPPIVRLFYRDPTDTYKKNLVKELQTNEKVKEELNKGIIKFRSIPEDAIQAYAKSLNKTTSKKSNVGGTTDDDSSPVTGNSVERNYEVGEETRAGLEVSLATSAEVNARVAPVLANRDVESITAATESLEGNSATNSQSNISAGHTDTAASLSANISIGALSLEDAKNLLEKSKPHSAFFEEFGGQLEHGRCMFEPMQLCVILMSRRFRDSDETKDMVVTFTGYVDSVSDGFDGTRHILSVVGSDANKLMKITQANINPSLFTSKMPSSSQYKIWQNRFGGLDGWEIIKLLTIGGEITDTESGIPDRIHGAGSFEFRSVLSPDDRQKFDKSVLEHTSLYDPHVSRTEILNGGSKAPGELTKDASDRIENLFFNRKTVHIQTLPFDTSPVNDLQSYDVFKRIFGMSFLNWQNDYQSHYEIATQVARLTNYEFYADGHGDVWYHQPRFHNYHILTHATPEIYILRDEDILNCNLTESDDQVITSVYVVGTPNFYTGPKEVVKMVGFYEDPSLVLKYGRRMLTTRHPYVVSEGDINFFARSYLIRVNAARYVGTINILGRPEIKMHMPIYIPFRNMVYYVVGISHSMTFGSRFVTTLTLKYGRKPWEVIPEILDYSERANPNMSAQAVKRATHMNTVKEAKVSAEKQVPPVTAIPRPFESISVDSDEFNANLSTLNPSKITSSVPGEGPAQLETYTDSEGTLRWSDTGEEVGQSLGGGDN